MTDASARLTAALKQMAYEAALSRRPSVFIRSATNVQINEAGTR